jgi:hypothetical protein
VAKRSRQNMADSELTSVDAEQSTVYPIDISTWVQHAKFVFDYKLFDAILTENAFDPHRLLFDRLISMGVILTVTLQAAGDQLQTLLCMKNRCENKTNETVFYYTFYV